MTATHPDLAALCAALDRGDDGALGPLADLLEEQGDGRAAGLRALVARYDGTADTMPETWGDGKARWHCYSHDRKARGRTEYSVAPAIYDRMEQAESWAASGRATCGDYLEWDTRSAAFLALAEALARG